MRRNHTPAPHATASQRTTVESQFEGAKHDSTGANFEPQMNPDTHGFDFEFLKIPISVFMGVLLWFHSGRCWVAALSRWDTTKRTEAAAGDPRRERWLTAWPKAA